MILIPLLKCLNNQEANQVLTKIHEGLCGNHSGDQALAQKVLRGLLMANHDPWYLEPSKEIWPVSKVLKDPRASSETPYLDHKRLVVCQMGNETDQPTPDKIGISKVLHYYHWLFHQMGWSWASFIDNQTKMHLFHMEIHHQSTQHPSFNNDQ